MGDPPPVNPFEAPASDLARREPSAGPRTRFTRRTLAPAAAGLGVSLVMLVPGITAWDQAQALVPMGHFLPRPAFWLTPAERLPFPAAVAATTVAAASAGWLCERLRGGRLALALVASTNFTLHVMALEGRSWMHHRELAAMVCGLAVLGVLLGGAMGRWWRKRDRR